MVVVRLGIMTEIEAEVGVGRVDAPPVGLVVFPPALVLALVPVLVLVLALVAMRRGGWVSWWSRDNEANTR